MSIDSFSGQIYHPNLEVLYMGALTNSIDLALMIRRKKMRWLTEQMGVTKAQAYNYRSTEDPHWSTICRLAEIFDMAPSEFIKLGETINGNYQKKHVFR